VHEEQALQKAELRDGEVGDAGGLQAFFAGDADADVLGVVSAVREGEWGRAGLTEAWIMAISLAPSPMARVREQRIRVRMAFTTAAFCAGLARQHMTESRDGRSE
jgi:hypothetical protein